MAKNDRFSLDSILDSVTSEPQRPERKASPVRDGKDENVPPLPRPQRYRSGGKRTDTQPEKYGGQTVLRNGTVKRGYYLSVEVVEALRKKAFEAGELSNASIIVEAALRKYLGLSERDGTDGKGGVCR